MRSIEPLEPRTLMAAGDIDSAFTPIVRNITPTRFDPAHSEARDVAIDGTGRSVVFGNATDIVSGRRIMYVARFQTDGSADLSFGDYGVRILDLAVGQDARHIAIDDAGRIDLAYDTTQPTGPMMQVAQLDRNGVFNRRFGRNGITFPRFGNSSMVADLTTDRQNNLVFVANAANQIGIGKLTNSGRTHPDFGAKSVRFIPSTTGGSAGAVAIDADNNIVVGATLPSRTVSDFAAIKLTHEGLVDATFGRKGYVAVDPSGRRDQLDSLIIDGYGRLVLSGKAAYGSAAIAAAARYTADGALDSTFFRRGSATGAMWAENPGEVQRFATHFTDPDVQLLDGNGLYQLFMDGATVTIGYGGRRAGLLDSPTPTEFDAFRHLPTTSHFVAATSRNGVMAFVTAGRRSVAAGLNADDAMIGSSFVPHIGNTLADNLQTKALQLSFVSGTPGVLVDGSLVVSREVAQNYAYVKYDAAGNIVDAFGSDGVALDDHIDNTYRGAAFAPESIVPLSNGGFFASFEGSDPGDGDNVAVTVSRFGTQGDVLSRFQSTDEAYGNVAAGPLDTLLFNYEPDGSAAYGAGFIRASAEVEQYLWRESSIEAPLAGPPTLAIPIPGDTRVYVQGYLPSDTGERISYLQRIVPGTPGNVDSTFGGGSLTPFDGEIICAQSGGALLYTLNGQPGLRRFNADGSVDLSFGTSGVMGANLPGANYTVDNAGRLIAWRELVGGAADGDVQIARFTANGQPDTTFGGDGIIAVDTHINSQGTPNVIVDAQNRIIVTSMKQSRTSVSWSATRILA